LPYKVRQFIKQVAHNGEQCTDYKDNDEQESEGQGFWGEPTRSWQKSSSNALRGGGLGSLVLLIGDTCCLGTRLGLVLPLCLHELHLIRVHPPQLPHILRVPLVQPLQPHSPPHGVPPQAPSCPGSRTRAGLPAPRPARRRGSRG
jgi:hypothetical protein